MTKSETNCLLARQTDGTSSAKEFPHDFAGRGDDGCGDVKGSKLESQALKIDPSQMLVAGQQDGAVEQSGFGQNKSIMHFFRWQQVLPEKPEGDPFDELVAKRNVVYQLKAPGTVALQKAARGFTVFSDITVIGDKREFLGGGWWNKDRSAGGALTNGGKCIDDPFALDGEIEADIGVSGDANRRVDRSGHKQSASLDPKVSAAPRVKAYSCAGGISRRWRRLAISFRSLAWVTSLVFISHGRRVRSIMYLILAAWQHLHTAARVLGPTTLESDSHASVDGNRSSEAGRNTI